MKYRINMEATGKNIRRLMEINGLNVRSLQKLMGIGSYQAIYHWINGKTIPSIDNLMLLAQIFETTVDQIIVMDESQE